MPMDQQTKKFLCWQGSLTLNHSKSKGCDFIMDKESVCLQFRKFTGESFAASLSRVTLNGSLQPLPDKGRQRG